MPQVRGRSAFEGRLIEWVIDRPVDVPRLPVAWLSKEQKAAELQRVQAEKATRAAYEAELICGLADDTPDSADPPPDHPGARGRGWAPDTELPGVSEFFPAELSMLLNCGRLDEVRAAALADVLGSTPPEISREVEQEVLPEAASLSVGRLKSRALEVLLAYDSTAADQRRAQAKRAADVRVYPSHLDGMATLSTDLPVEEATACHAVVDQLARMLQADGDRRPIGELRAAVLSMLIRRPADHGLGTTAISLTVTAALAALAGETTAPGAVGGLPITAGHLRELLRRAGALGLTAPDRGSLTFALTDADGALLATLTPAQLARLARAGCPAHPHEDCGCPLTGRPPTPTRRPPPSARSSPPATAPAGSPTAGSGSAGPTWTTCSPTPTAARPAARTCAACAVASPAEDLRPRLAVRHGRRRHPARHHPLRRHPHHPTTRPAPTRTGCSERRPTHDGERGRRPAACLAPRLSTFAPPAGSGRAEQCAPAAHSTS